MIKNGSLVIVTKDINSDEHVIYAVCQALCDIEIGLAINRFMIDNPDIAQQKEEYSRFIEDSKILWMGGLSHSTVPSGIDRYDEHRNRFCKWLLDKQYVKKLDYINLDLGTYEFSPHEGDIETNELYP